MKTNKPANSAADNRQLLTFETRDFGMAKVVTSAYQSGGRLAVKIVDEDGESIATLSVNMPECSHLLSRNEFFAKTWTWSENAEIAENALASGIFRDTGRTSGELLNARIWTFG